MIGGNTIAYKPKRYWQMLIHVNYGFAVPTHQPAGGIEACWARADDGETEGPVGLHRSAVLSASSMVPNALSRNQWRPVVKMSEAAWTDVRFPAKGEHGVGVRSKQRVFPFDILTRDG